VKRITTSHLEIENFDLMQGETTEYKSLLEEKKRIKE